MSDSGLGPGQSTYGGDSQPELRALGAPSDCRHMEECRV